MSWELTLLGVSYSLNIYLIVRLYMARKIINNAAQSVGDLLEVSDVVSQRITALRQEAKK